MPLRILYAATRELPTDQLNSQWNTMKNSLNAKVILVLNLKDNKVLKMQEIRVARQLAAQLPQTAALLNDLLNKDVYLRVRSPRFEK